MNIIHWLGRYNYSPPLGRYIAYLRATMRTSILIIGMLLSVAVMFFNVAVATPDESADEDWIYDYSACWQANTDIHHVSDE